MQQIAISGAGLAGTLLAISLAKRGYQVDLYERRPDARGARVDLGRSINLALSARGSHALSRVGLLDRVLSNAVPMKARAIHSAQGEVAYQAFGRTADEYLSAIERHTLNMVLLDAAEEQPNIRIHFNQRLTGIDFSTMTLSLQDQGSQATSQRACQRLVATEGAFSAARKIMVEKGLAEFVVDELAYGYKELPITVEQALKMRRECLHLWPRRSFLMIANPNPDGSFSCTLFLPHQGGEASFAEMKGPGDVERLFGAHFADALERMPSVATDFFSRPTGILPTVKGGPWYVEDKVLLLGDAAHALVPFFAQGMNSAFEDCTVLTECLDRCQDRWDEAIPAFFAARKANTDAIADMAMQNYREIQDFIADDRFRLRKQIEHELMQRFPEIYTSMHVLVMFTRVPYAFAKSCGALQGTLLDAICEGVVTMDQVHWPAVEPLLARYADDVRRLGISLQLDLGKTSSMMGRQ